MMRKYLLPLAALFALCASPAFAALQVDVTQANVQPLPIAIPDFVAGDATGANIAGVVRADLERSGLFKPIDPKAFVDHVTNINVVPNFANWRVISAQGLVTGDVVAEPDGRLRVDFRLWDVYGESQMVGTSSSAQPANWRRI